MIAEIQDGSAIVVVEATPIHRGVAENQVVSQVHQPGVIVETTSQTISPVAIEAHPNQGQSISTVVDAAALEGSGIAGDNTAGDDGQTTTGVEDSTTVSGGIGKDGDIRQRTADAPVIEATASVTAARPAAQAGGVPISQDEVLHRYLGCAGDQDSPAQEKGIDHGSGLSIDQAGEVLSKAAGQGQVMGDVGGLADDLAACIERMDAAAVPVSRNLDGITGLAVVDG